MLIRIGRVVLVWLIFGSVAVQKLPAATASLVSISVAPSPASISAGNKLQFSATGTYSDGSKQSITKSVKWSSSSTAVATVNTSGTATGVAPGSVTIKALSGSVSGTASLQVTAPVLSSITVTPANPTLATGATQQFVAMAKYSDGSSADVSGSVVWASSAPSVATISSSGSALGIGAGQSTVSATEGAVTGHTTLTVTAPSLVKITVSPSAPSSSPGLKVQFAATGKYADGSTKDISGSVTWRSSSTGVATISSTGLATPIAAGTTNITASLSRVSGSTTLTVAARTLQSIAVTPANSAIPLGAVEQLTATGMYSDGSTQNLTATVSWGSTNTGTASVSSSGLVSSHAVGAATITATLGSVSGQTNLTVTSAVLASISVTPVSASIPLGTNAQFTATGTYTDGTAQNLSASVSWNSSVPSVATVGQTGVATSAAQGVTSISASLGSIQSNAATLTVLPAVLQSIAVTPANASIAAGLTEQFTATGTYSDGSSQDLTTSVTWRSDAAGVATVSASGLASGVATGSANISAVSGTINGSTSLTVTASQLVSIAITPAIPSIPLGTTQQFTATGTYTDNSTQDLTATAQWSSSDSGVANISNSAGSYGLARSGGTGSTTILALLGDVSGSTTLTVKPAALESITVTPANPSIVAGTSQQFTATGTYSDSTTVDLTSTAAWSSDSPTVATVDSTGVAQALSTGSAGIKATVGSVSGVTALTVTSAPLVSITVAPSDGSIPLGTTEAFSATGNYADGSQQILTSGVHWSTSDATVATVSNATGTTGLATSVSVGSVTVTATSGGISGTASLTVTPATLVSLAVTPMNANVALGGSQQFTATGTYTDGSTKNITTNVTWTSSAATVAVISNNIGSQGMATSAGAGSTTISAAMGGVSASTTLTVGSPQLVSVSVTPVNPSISRGATVQFTATGNYSDGSTANITSSVAWSSSSASVATVGAGGIATGASPGSTAVTATSGTIAGSTTLMVTAPVLTGVAIAPANASIALGTTQQFTATAIYSDSSTQDVTSVAAWSSSTASVATINSTGLASAVNFGMATISVNYGGLNSATILTVQASSLVSVTIPTDVGLPLDVAVANGTPITTAMLNSATVGSDCVVGGTGTSSCSWTAAGSGFTVGTSQSGCANPGLIAVNLGNTYGAGAWNDRSMVFDATKILNTSLFSTPGTNITSASTLFCAVMGMSASSNSYLFDMLVVEDLGGYYAVMPQLMTSCGGVTGNFAVNIEGVSATAGTVHSGCIKLTQGATYWFAGNYNSSAGTAGLSVYTPTGTLVGSVSLSNLRKGNSIFQMRIGNNESGVFTGKVYFQNLLVNWTNHPVPFYW